jgi:protein-S-isoprenylcysteine O-methyltransferase Ste14
MTNKIELFLKHPAYNLVSTAILLSLYLYFLLNHVLAIKSGDISPVVFIFIVMETIVIILLLTRKNVTEKTTNLKQIAVAIGTTLLPLILLPTTNVISEGIGNTLIIIGGLLAIGAYLSLNNSFGVTPALREVKTKGLYKLVRHPMYLSYFFIYIGYLNLSFSVTNSMILIVLVIGLVTRIIFEEALLIKEPAYQAYSKQVKYKLFPYIF